MWQAIAVAGSKMRSDPCPCHLVSRRPSMTREQQPSRLNGLAGEHAMGTGGGRWEQVAAGGSAE